MKNQKLKRKKEIHEDKRKHVLGGQGCIWTVWFPTGESVEKTGFPRTTVLSEVLWTYPEERDFEAFDKRLTVFKKRLDILNVKYYKPEEEKEE